MSGLSPMAEAAAFYGMATNTYRAEGERLTLALEACRRYEQLVARLDEAMEAGRKWRDAMVRNAGDTLIEPSQIREELALAHALVGALNRVLANE